ncbi:DNA polymerase III subunit gamma/tau [Sphingomonas sp. 10B4]|uniref:DNA polymerase III subunit gamma/tau n=1 Tax=Sphingomonas sp. 10B4 TaxID=3048575 RepID=UPI002AB52957|nr:DNA polymerase III subunit gamma/tau [Sphingomonas sp. 10B4]MDY7522971.1 DNA polymerase III subunit gamma/tau [Sphingomonas sp. 10B4]MEB0281316.1 DNA polymerase III subunit gamma/tau [Sphingomonas sp. 10B4]
MSDSFDLDLPATASKDAYRVLARKYRPQTFGELIGQDAMVTTLGNAIRRGRLAHAFLLTGVRGVGKTSTARLLAKALNCIGPDGSGGPTIDPCGVCEPCVGIAEGRHIDVIEMDAASHTGVDDMRAVIDASRMTAFVARYKIYIIDEVHMLSKNAFNALLKTLEEPAEGVKFVLATTEVNKVPVTVLSRCQRFDLRRIPAEKLAEHFARVSKAEGVEAEPEALGLIARAAEGSARDGLSILDQAIAHADMDGGAVSAAAVRDMLGLSDRGAIRDLMALLIASDGVGALAALRRQYDLGVDPLGVLRGLLETVHATTLVKLGATQEAGQATEEREALVGWAETLSFAVLHRLWQLLLKGHDEVARAAMPIEACEMALLRLVHASSLPDPGELARMIAAGAPMMAAPVAQAAAAPAQAPAAEAVLPSTVEGIVALLEDAGELALSSRIVHHASVISIVEAELVLSNARPLPADLVGDLGAALKALTRRAWKITTSPKPGRPTLREAEAAQYESFKASILASPMIEAAFAAFPGAELPETEIKSLLEKRRHTA